MNNKPNKLFQKVSAFGKTPRLEGRQACSSLRGRGMRQGAILAVIVVVILLISLTGLSLLAVGKHVRLRAVETMHDTTAKCAADAGLAHAQYLAFLAYKTRPWPGVAPATDVSLDETNATYSYTVTGDPLTGITIEGVGKCMRAERKVNCLMKEKADIVGMGMGEGGTELGNGFHMASTDVRRAKLQTTSIKTKPVAAIDIGGGNTDIKADLVIGKGGDPTLGKGIVLKKTDSQAAPYTRSAVDENPVYPDVEVPASLTGLAGTNTAGGPATVSSSGSYRYDVELGGLTVAAGVNATVYVDGTLNGAIMVGSGGSLTLYVNGNMGGKNQITYGISPTPDVTDATQLRQAAEAITIFGTPNCTSIAFKNGWDSFGLLYAPQAWLLFDNSSNSDKNMYGGIVVYGIKGGNNFGFVFIPDLADNILVPAKRVVVDRWWE